MVSVPWLVCPAVPLLSAPRPPIRCGNSASTPEKLGLEPISTSPFGDLRYEAGGVEFLVYQSELAGTNQATAAGFRLENFDEVVAFLRSHGVEFEHVDFGAMGATVDGVITTPDGQKAAWFKDSEGNTLALSMAD